MLVLSRSDREGIRFRLPDGTEFQVFVEAGSTQNRFRLLVDAPREISVSRISPRGRVQCSNPNSKGKGGSSWRTQSTTRT
jgi:hypothetical protein